MQVVDKPGLPPGICIVCETKPTEKQTAVDTQRDFEPGGPTYLNGRKYVCESCAHEFARLYDFVSKKSVEDLKIAHDWAVARISELEDRARQVAEQILGGAKAVEAKVREAGKAPAKPKAKKDEV